MRQNVHILECQVGKLIQIAKHILRSTLWRTCQGMAYEIFAQQEGQCVPVEE